DHRRRTGCWPTAKSGPVPGAPGLTWLAVQMALFSGHRGLPGGSTLARLLDEHRRVGRRAWTPGDDKLVRTLPPAEAPRRTGRTPAAVYRRRHALSLPEGGRCPGARSPPLNAPAPPHSRGPRPLPSSGRAGGTLPPSTFRTRERRLFPPLAGGRLPA